VFIVVLFVVVVVVVLTDLGMGLRVSKSLTPQNENGVSPMGESTGGEEEEEERHVLLHAMAVYPFSGTSEDEVYASHMTTACMGRGEERG
jgi:hypothetical protein